MSPFSTSLLVRSEYLSTLFLKTLYPYSALNVADRVRRQAELWLFLFECL